MKSGGFILGISFQPISFIHFSSIFENMIDMNYQSYRS